MPEAIQSLASSITGANPFLNGRGREFFCLSHVTWASAHDGCVFLPYVWREDGKVQGHVFGVIVEHIEKGLPSAANLFNIIECLRSGEKSQRDIVHDTKLAEKTVREALEYLENVHVVRIEIKPYYGAAAHAKIVSLTSYGTQIYDKLKGPLQELMNGQSNWSVGQAG